MIGVPPGADFVRTLFDRLTNAYEGQPPEALADEADATADDEEEDDDRPDLLLRESARIVGDMIELGNDEPALARQFSLLGKVEAQDSLN